MKCKACNEREMALTLRGLCRRCYFNLKKEGKLDSYPASTNITRMYERLIKNYGDGFICCLSKLHQGTMNRNQVALSFGLSRQRVTQIIQILTEEK